MWNSVKTARRHGWNVRKTEAGWQVARLSIDGWQWSPFAFPTKTRALRHCHTCHNYA